MKPEPEWPERLLLLAIFILVGVVLFGAGGPDGDLVELPGYKR